MRLWNMKAAEGYWHPFISYCRVWLNTWLIGWLETHRRRSMLPITSRLSDFPHSSFTFAFSYKPSWPDIILSPIGKKKSPKRSCSFITNVYPRYTVYCEAMRERVCAHKYRYLGIQERVSESVELEWQVPNLVAGNWTRVPWRTKAYS